MGQITLNKNGTFTFTISATDLGGGTSDVQSASARIEWHGSQISCIGKSRRQNPTQHIQFVGGLHPDGRRWRLSLAETIAEIERGQQFYVERPEGDRVKVVVAVGRRGHQYLKTEADGDLPNNLLSLTECPQLRTDLMAWKTYEAPLWSLQREAFDRLHKPIEYLRKRARMRRRNA